MKKTKLNEKIVCDLIGCGGLSTYRLTFRNGTDLFLCENCFNEMKDFFKNLGENDETKQRK